MGRKAFVKDRIEEAAFDLFARRGYEAVSTREIAAAAKVGHASMYRHYASMEELGRIVYSRALSPLILELKDMTQSCGKAKGKYIEKLVYLFCGWYDNKPRALALLIFPPHDFTPFELSADNPDTPRNIMRDKLNCDDDTLSVIWGALTGPLQDRFLRRREGLMLEQAAGLATIIRKLAR